MLRAPSSATTTSDPTHAVDAFGPTTTTGAEIGGSRVTRPMHHRFRLGGRCDARQSTLRSSAAIARSGRRAPDRHAPRRRPLTPARLRRRRLVVRPRELGICACDAEHARRCARRAASCLPTGSACAANSDPSSGTTR